MLLDHHPPLMLPYLRSTTLCHKAFLLPNKACLTALDFGYPVYCLKMVYKQFPVNQVEFTLRDTPPHKKSLFILSILQATPIGMGNKDKQLGGLIRCSLKASFFPP